MTARADRSDLPALFVDELSNKSVVGGQALGQIVSHRREENFATRTPFLLISSRYAAKPERKSGAIKSSI
jgi:hypothetical protein